MSDKTHLAAPEGEADASCTCANDGNARRCPHHTQADYDASAATDASGLTESERDALRGLAFTVPDRVRLESAVERIVAERLRVVEGERDAEAEQSAYWHTMQQRYEARAESAEAQLRAVEALATRWEKEARSLGPSLSQLMLRSAASDLRALLAGGGA